MTGPVACFGEVLLRLASTGGASLRDTDALALHVGGAEANVAVALASLGIGTRMISALPDNALGTLAKKALQREGVSTQCLASAPGRMGLYFLDPAAGPRGGQVVYDRAASAFAQAESVDPAALDSAAHLHVSGISLAVSEASAEATLALAKEARARGLSISFDGNYRPALWQARGTDGRAQIADMVAMADLVFANHRDVSLLLERDFGADGSSRRREAAVALLEAFPTVRTIASTARHIDNGTTHRIVARVDDRAGEAQSGERMLAGIVDRIGTGDAFAAGVLACWLEAPEDLQKAAEGGAALSALKHYQSGDFCRASRAEWLAAMEGVGDVVR